MIRPLIILIVSSLAALAGEVTLSLDSSVPAEGTSFKDAVLWVRVWEYDPKLADVGAKNVADSEVENCSHIMGELSSFSAEINVELKETMAYYVTSELYPNAEKRRADRFYFADGFNTVFDAKADDSQTISLTSLK